MRISSFEKISGLDGAKQQNRSIYRTDFKSSSPWTGRLCASLLQHTRSMQYSTGTCDGTAIFTKVHARNTRKNSEPKKVVPNYPKCLV